MSLRSEFKAFVMRGNVLDLAIAVVIGGAFGKIVSSFVADVITPLLGLAVGGVKFSKLAIVLQEHAEPEKVISLRYGVFLQAIFDFLIIALAIFAVVKMFNSMRKKEAAAPAAPAPPAAEVVLLTEIRDLLQAQKS